MASHSKKFNYGVLSIIGLTLSFFLAEGQSFVVGDQKKGQQSINDLEWFNEFKSYLKEAVVLTRSVKSDIKDLKGEIEMLKHRIEDHHDFVNSSYLDLTSRLVSHQIPTRNREVKPRVQHQQIGRRDCPEGFSYSVVGFPKCYAPLSDKVDWNTAQERCRQLHNNSRLAVIVNSREQEIITDIVKNLGCAGTKLQVLPTGQKQWVNAFWIGAQRVNTSDCDSPFEWTTNNETTSSIVYSNWDSGEPNCAMQSEACVSLNKYTAYTWNDLMCEWSACPLCEVTA